MSYEYEERKIESFDGVLDELAKLEGHEVTVNASTQTGPSPGALRFRGVVGPLAMEDEPYGIDTDEPPIAPGVHAALVRGAAFLPLDDDGESGFALSAADFDKASKIGDSLFVYTTYGLGIEIYDDGVRQ